MQERLVRFGLPGVVFLATTIFFYWYFAGNVEYLVKSLTTQPAVIALITSLIITTPVLGFTISTTIAAILKYSDHYHFFKIENKDLERKYFQLMISFYGNDSGIRKKKGTYIIVNLDHAYLLHDLLYRQVADAESLKYTGRRVDIFWVNINSIWSITWGLVIGLALALYNQNEITDLNCTKALWVLPIVIYVISGMIVAKKDIRDSNRFEKFLLIHSPRVQQLMKERNQ
jgi:uncharacterized protein YacL